MGWKFNTERWNVRLSSQRAFDEEVKSTDCAIVVWSGENHSSVTLTPSSRVVRPGQWRPNSNSNSRISNWTRPWFPRAHDPASFRNLPIAPGNWHSGGPISKVEFMSRGFSSVLNDRKLLSKIRSRIPVGVVALVVYIDMIY